MGGAGDPLGPNPSLGTGGMPQCGFPISATRACRSDHDRAMSRTWDGGCKICFAERESSAKHRRMCSSTAPPLAKVAEAALRGSRMDSVGLYRLDDQGRMDGVILGMPDAFICAYETQGIPIDPVLAQVRKSGAPASTLVTLGGRWTSCHLY